MICFITGASGSGKSEYAENLAVSFARKRNQRKLYLATMENYGAESNARILRHRMLRAGKGFYTIEAPFGWKKEFAEYGEIVLVECMSNLLANLMFSKGQSGISAEMEILSQIKEINSEKRMVIIVSNEIFSDGVNYEGDTREYQKILGRINQALIHNAEIACEVVYSIPVFLKGEELCQ